MVILTSLHNPKVAMFRSLKDRKGRLEHRAFLVEGRKSVEEALRSPFALKALILEEGLTPPFPLPNAPVYSVPRSVMEKICDTRTPQGLCAVMGMPAQTAGGSRILALDGLQDPGNVGTILRTADAAGFDSLILSGECADIYSPKVLRATMGSVFHLPCERTEDLAGRLQGLASGMPVLASVLGGDPFFPALRSLPDTFCLVIGNEGSGITPEVQKVCTHRLTLPMQGGAESLNAAIAAGIMMYALTNRHFL